MKRRAFLESAAASTVAVLAGRRQLEGAPFAAPAPPGWRTFEVATRLEVLGAAGVTRAWVPLPLMADTSWQRRLGDTWQGNAPEPRVWRDQRYDAGLVYAEWPATVRAPALEVTSRFCTLDRAVDLAAASPDAPKESAASLARFLEPTKLMPTDGIVLKTSREITQGRATDVDKARAIYEWIVENTFRDPKVRGCGTGDIQAMLETRYLGGKCADLNALFVGLARAAGVPAREVFGIRVAESKEWKSLGRAGDVTRAQHCRAEFHDASRGWVPVDPADVRKVVLEEPPAGRTLDDPAVQKARRKLFGAWEMNYLAFNYGHDLSLPGAPGPTLPFLMYPQCQTAGARKDSLDPAALKYEITSRELSS